jgi:hypothetical protein
MATTQPTVSVSAVPMSNWSNPAPAPNLNMGSVNVGNGAVKSTTSSTGVTTPTPTVTPPIVTNSSGTGSAMATSGVSSMLDANGMIDVNKANVDNTQLTQNHSDYLALLDNQNNQLETRRQNEINSINSSFDTAGTRLKQNQASETGTYTSTLARIGGYLGNSASATGAMVNLNQTHVNQVNDLEAKRQAAIQEANNAISDKQFEIARAKISEAKDYTKAIQDSKQKFFENNQQVIKDQQQGQKDAAIAKLYSEGTTDPATILSSLKSSGLYTTAEEINKTITNLVPAAISDLIKNLDKYGAPGDVKLKVLNSKNANEAYANAGAWANLGGEGKPGAYNFYVASQKAAGKPYVDYMTFDNQDQILKNQQNQTAGYTGGSAYTTPGASGEYGAYQFTPDTWKNYAGEILNDPNAPMTPANQDAVAIGMVSKWVADGKTPEQIAIKWNHGDFSYKGSGTGVNSMGVKYDIPGYVAKFKSNLAKIGGGNDPTTIAKAIKLTETGGGEGDIAVERAVNIINGSNKFTKEQKNSFISAMNSASNVGDAIGIIKNQAKDNMGQTNATQLAKLEEAKKDFESLTTQVNQFYKDGGTSNIMKGIVEQGAQYLGNVSDPKLRTMATQIETSLQAYRNAVSGTAYSNQEGVAIASIYPQIFNTQALNEAIIAGRQTSFDSRIDAMYETVLTKDVYKSLKEVEKTAGQTTGDVLAQKMDQQLTKLTQNYSDPVKKADIDSKISTIESKLGRKISREEFLQAYPSYGN